MFSLGITFEGEMHHHLVTITSILVITKSRTFGIRVRRSPTAQAGGRDENPPLSLPSAMLGTQTFSPPPSSRTSLQGICLPSPHIRAGGGGGSRPSRERGRVRVGSPFPSVLLVCVLRLPFHGGTRQKARVGVGGFARSEHGTLG